MKLTKLLALFLAVLMVVAVFAACNNSPASPSGDATDKPQESSEPTDEQGAEPTATEEVEEVKLELDPNKTTFTHWTGYSGSDRPYLEKIFGDFNKNDEIGQIQMSIMTWAILDQKMATSYASNEGPDTICGGTALRTNWFQGCGCDLTPAYDDGRLTLDIYPQSVLDDIQFDDGIWATPMCVFGSALYMNMDKLTEAGYTGGPSTTDELIEMGKKLTKLGDGGEVEQYGFAFNYNMFFSYFMWEKGYDVVDLSTAKSTVNAPGVAELLEQVSGYVRDDKISPLILDNGNMMIAGKLAMYANGPWDTTLLTDGGVNFDVANLPGPTGGLANHFIPTKWLKEGDAKKYDAFVNFSKHWLEKENQLIWCNGSGYPLLRVDQDPSELDQTKWAWKFTDSKDSRRFSKTAQIPGLQNVDGDTGILSNLWQQAIYGQITDYQAALDQAASEIDAEIEAVGFTGTDTVREQ